MTGVMWSISEVLNGLKDSIIHLTLCDYLLCSDTSFLMISYPCTVFHQILLSGTTKEVYVQKQLKGVPDHFYPSISVLHATMYKCLLRLAASTVSFICTFFLCPSKHQTLFCMSPNSPVYHPPGFFYGTSWFPKLLKCCYSFSRKPTKPEHFISLAQRVLKLSTRKPYTSSFHNSKKQKKLIMYTFYL